MACDGLTIAGGVAQVGGFALTWWELSRTQRREFPEHVPFHHRASAWLRRKLRRSKPTVFHEGELVGTVHASGSLEHETHRVVPPDLQGRVARLEKVEHDLRRRMSEDRSKLEERIRQVELRSMEGHASLRGEIADAEAKRKTNLRESILYERIGVVLFAVGVVLSVLGSTV
jgi:hypothetical protein